MTSDPCAEDGCLWFFNFFLYNRKMKRIVFVSCRCTSKSVDSNYDEEIELDEIEATHLQPTWTYSINFTNSPASSSSSAAANVGNSAVAKPVNTVLGFMD